MKMFGVDLSRWQGNFNFSKAISEGVQFAIIKGGGGDAGLYVDSKFTRNYEEAKKKGLPVGVYWFSKALTVADAEREADYFFTKVLQGRQFELPVYIDVEHKRQLAVGKRRLTDIVKAWCSHLEGLGFWVGVYSSQAFFNAYMYDAELTRYAHWVACWASSCSYPYKDCFGMWQFGGDTNKIRTNRVAGVVCDQNYMLFDYPSAIKAAGLNGFTKPDQVGEPEPEKPVGKTVEELAREVIAGLWGAGRDRRDRLTKAGYDYRAGQAKGNAILSK